MGKVLAIGMISGGLDSTLATKVLLDQGIQIHGVHFNTGFCFVYHRRQIARPDEPPERLRNPVSRLGALFGIPIESLDISTEYLDVLRHPKYGYGKNMNPCIDCRIMMMQKAKLKMEELGADFVYTGEVVGQRPMSQHKPTLRLIEKQAGLEGRLLRPLSAKLLPETEPELKGLVDRSRLHNFSGRTRKPQMALVEHYGIDDFPQPAGGCCFLTDPAYARKLKDLFAHKNPDDCTRNDLMLLGVGRHLRISPDLKLIVGRDEHENRFIDSITSNLIRLEAIGVVGPVVLAEGNLTPENLTKAAAVTARYSDGNDRAQLQVRFRTSDREGELTVEPIAPDLAAQWVIH
jgi:tRNA-specific 2-thiouridylase